MSRAAPRASSRAPSAASRAWASSDSFPTRLCSKPSLFFTASWSSRSAVITLASCFSRSACSASAFLLASAKAFFSASYSAPAPRAHNTKKNYSAQPFVRANSKTNVFNIPCLSSNCFFTRPSSSSARARLCFSSDTSALKADVLSADACFHTKGYTSFTQAPAKAGGLIPCPALSPSPDSASGATTHIMTIPQGFPRKHTSKAFIRPRQDSFSPLSAD